MESTDRSFRRAADADAIESIVRRRRIQRLWHLSRVDHLKSIFSMRGLLSRAEMDQAGIAYDMSSWGAVGKDEELKDYICCSLVSPWGMSRQDSDSKVLLQLQPRLLWREGTLFSPDWSSHNYISLPDLLRNNSARVFDSMFQNPTTGFPSPPPGEVLIPHSIDLAYFIPLVFFHSEESKGRALDELNGVIMPDGRAAIESYRLVVSPYQFRGNYPAI